MHVIFQFPITDLRPLADDKDLRLVRPLWSSPDIDGGRPFIRQFGRLKNRPLGGISGWAAEEHFCDARLSIKYKDIHKNGFEITNGKKAVIYKVYRRLYSDGNFMNKIELGFVDDLEDRLKNNHPSLLIKLENVLNHYYELPVQIDKNIINLSEAASFLREKFAKATTYKEKYTEEISQFIFSGQLNITVVLTSMDNISLPSDAKLISEYKVSQKTIFVYGFKTRLGNQNVKIWVIKAFKNTDGLPKDNPLKTVVRNLRINLARIHAERETLRLLLSNIMIKKIPLEPGTDEAKMVQGYIKRVAVKLFAKKRNKLDQEDILNFALASEELVLPGTLDSLNETAIAFKDKYTKGAIRKLAYGLKKNKVKTILYLTSNPNGKQPLNIQSEIDAILNRYDSGKNRELYKVQFEPSVESDELIGFMNKYQPYLLHISLHASKVDGLYFENANHEPAAISTQQFEDIIETYTKHYQLKAVILSACNSLGHAKAALPFCSNAMGTNTAIPDEATPVYARYFYQTLFDSKEVNIQACHDIAVLQLRQSSLQTSGETKIDEMFELLTNKQN